MFVHIRKIDRGSGTIDYPKANFVMWSGGVLRQDQADQGIGLAMETSDYNIHKTYTVEVMPYTFFYIRDPSPKTEKTHIIS